MLAARDQENLRHTHQQAAANKPFNQTSRNLPVRTPGNQKTPFRASRNDENAPTGFGKLNGGLKTVASKSDQNTFVTPAAPRNRAPLGLKTTNAKGQAFKTPAPTQQLGKPQKLNGPTSTGQRSAKSKFTVAPSEPIKTDVLNDLSEEDEPDFGYAPPHPIPLADPPLDIDVDQIIPQFSIDDFYKSYGQVYLASPKDEHGFSIRLKKEDEEYKKFQAERMQQSLQDLNLQSLPDLSSAELNAQVDAIIAAGPKQKKVRESKPDTVKARSAVQALASSTVKAPLAAKKQTASSEQKRKVVTKPAVIRRQAPESQAIKDDVPSPRMVSKNTIGFPKARKAPSIIPITSRNRPVQHKPTSTRPKIDQAEMHPKEYQRLYGEPPVESDMWFRLREYELLDEESERERLDADEPLFDPIQMSLGYGESDDEVFQLPMPE